MIMCVVHISFLLLYVCCLMISLHAFYSFFALLFVVNLGDDLNSALERFNWWLNSICVMADVLPPETRKFSVGPLNVFKRAVF